MKSEESWCLDFEKKKMASSQYKQSQHLGLRGGIQNDNLAFEKIIIMQQEEIKMEVTSTNLLKK